MTKKKKGILIGVLGALLVMAVVFTVGKSIHSKEKSLQASPSPAQETQDKVDHPSENKKTNPESNKTSDSSVKKSEAVKSKSQETKEKESKTQQSKEHTSTAVTKPATKYVAASSLNVRTGGGTDHAVMMTVKEGQEVSVYESDGSWSRVKVNDQSGWVATKYLSDKKPVVQTVNPPSTKKTNSSTAASTPKKPTANTNVADGLTTIAGNRQLILVTTNGSNTSRATIRTFEKGSEGKWNPVLNTTGYVGKYGMTSNMSEGGKKSPIGKFTIGTAFGRRGNPGTKLPFRSITSDDAWVDDPKSSLYNTWQSKSKTKGQWNSAENMNIPAYTYGFVINYNTQRIPYKGSAIFFHIGSSYTLGCTATSETNVITILKWLDPAKNPVIIQTPVQSLNKY
ncbi:hypothetical protein D9X91_13355 [Falsibacillus albus]|uniref:SH3b domain-containing protein n=2 Tax=Falsibacillus albus TaxID=2478915 RepID=A0A3L7JVU5_9BACI|nr:hypothetical protein D9X91_13355 [Falsibacillus albus]